MLVYHYTADDALTACDPFRGECSGPWIVYHGTSCHAEPLIDANGFAWSAGTYSRDDVAAVLEVFDRLHWCGSQFGGFSVLSSFTQTDFDRWGSRCNKPVFFAESAYRAVLYASNEWAGGETARALRLAFADLETFLNDPSFRASQIAESWRYLRSAVVGVVPADCEPQTGKEGSFENLRNLWLHCKSRGFAIPTPGRTHAVEPIDFTTSWLEGALSRLQSLRDRTRRLHDAFSHGVIYAVRFSAEDVGGLSYSAGGFCASFPVLPDRILAKAVVDKDVGYPGSVFNAANEAKIETLSGDSELLRALRGGNARMT